MERVVVKLDADGGIDEVLTDGPCEVYVVQDARADDRVYRLGHAHLVGSVLVDRELAGSPVGSFNDGSAADLRLRGEAPPTGGETLQ